MFSESPLMFVKLPLNRNKSWPQIQGLWKTTAFSEHLITFVFWGGFVVYDNLFLFKKIILYLWQVILVFLSKVMLEYLFCTQ